MGACGDGELPRRISTVVDRRVSKQVHDNVHGNIYLDPVSSSIIVSAYTFFLLTKLYCSSSNFRWLNGWNRVVLSIFFFFICFAQVKIAVNFIEFLVCVVSRDFVLYHAQIVTWMYSVHNVSYKYLFLYFRTIIPYREFNIQIIVRERGKHLVWWYL